MYEFPPSLLMQSALTDYHYNVTVKASEKGEGTHMSQPGYDVTHVITCAIRSRAAHGEYVLYSTCLRDSMTLPTNLT